MPDRRRVFTMRLLELCREHDCYVRVADGELAFLAEPSERERRVAEGDILAAGDAEYLPPGWYGLDARGNFVAMEGTV